MSYHQDFWLQIAIISLLVYSINMRTMLITLCLMACTPPDLPAARASIDQSLESLDGLVVPGKIRARGITGVFSVRGTLSFREGMLVWTVEGDEDVGAYSLIKRDGYVKFAAEHFIENNERVVWSGNSNGETVTDVTAVWTRVKGDFVHDVFLPAQVTLEFTPDS